MEQTNVLFKGVMPALVTPLREDESLNAEVLDRLTDHLLAENMDGFYVCGGTGEGPGLQKNVRMEAAETVCGRAKGRGNVIIHVGAVDLCTARDLARHAGQIGADAISSVPPFFFRYGEDEIRQYYTELSQAAGLPVIMYASPLSGVNITLDMVSRLMDIPGMIGLKWTSADYYTMHQMKQLRGGDINILNGPDETLMCGLAMGADGGIGATYNIMPKVIRRIYDCFQTGDMNGMREAQYQAVRLIDAIIPTGVVPSIKEILNMLGYDCGFCIAPTKRLNPEEKAALRARLDRISFEQDYL